MTTATYVVKGMTCGHCVNAVSTELANVDGVSAVAVDLETGTVTVTSHDPLDVESVRFALDEAGYELVT